jgi:2-haloacid dehalogenase
MKRIRNIVFDLGNVLVRWDPRFVYDEHYFENEEKRAWFFANVCTDAWNEIQDEGRSIVDATQELIARFPDWEPAIRDYYGRWADMLRGPIPESVEILRALKKKGKHGLYALTNWNAGLFEIALVRYDFLHWFDGRIVSGEEKARKPYPEFFAILEQRYGLVPSESIFIDDNLRNVKAGEALGYHCIHFQDAAQLRSALSDYGVI